MRKTLAVVALTAALTGGTATVALADDVVVAAPESSTSSQESDKTGLWGLLGLLGLAGLAKKKENKGTDAQARR